MGKYIFELLESNKINAGGKAKKDITQILKMNGYSEFYLDPNMNKLEKLLFAPNLIRRKVNEIESGSDFVFQYPLYSKRFSNLLFSQLFKRTDITKKIVIHDLESLRLHKDESKYIVRELNTISKFDVIISHNEAMTKWLKKNGINSKKIVNLDMFDYLNSAKMHVPSLEDPIVFAGNLKKSTFISKLPNDLVVELYGANPPAILAKKTSYLGIYPADELPRYLCGSFGLVWDGDSIDDCNGIYGEYLKYNNPHKASLYLSSGIPVIIWKNAALADFIVENNLGLAVDSLRDINGEVSKLTEDSYQQILTNVKKISNKLRTGWFTMRSIEHDKK